MKRRGTDLRGRRSAGSLSENFRVMAMWLWPSRPGSVGWAESGLGRRLSRLGSGGAPRGGLRGPLPQPSPAGLLQIAVRAKAPPRLVSLQVGSGDARTPATLPLRAFRALLDSRALWAPPLTLTHLLHASPLRPLGPGVPSPPDPRTLGPLGADGGPRTWRVRETAHGHRGRGGLRYSSASPLGKASQIPAMCLCTPLASVLPD